MNKINTGLRLRIAWLFFGMMFFFGIEQLFLNKIIRDSSTRGYLTIAYVVALVIFDIPTGILADRISRKLCLLLASFVQIAALIILGTSTTLPIYILGSFVFGIFICLINGAAQAVLYDWLALTNQTKKYAKEQGRNYAAFLIGAGIANIFSGFIANSFGLRSNYFLSIIPAILAFFVLLKLVDPPFAKKVETDWYKHLGEVVREVTRHRKVIVFSVQLVASGVAFYTVGEFGQIYMLAFGISTVALGLFWAIDAVFAAGGRFLAHSFQTYPRLLIITFCFVIFIFALIERKIGIGVFWLFYGLNEAISNVAETEIQHETSSHIRATTLSVVSFAGNLIAIPIILLYTHYYLRHGIFAANKLIIIALVIVLLATLLVRPSKVSQAEDQPLTSMPPAI